MTKQNAMVLNGCNIGWFLIVIFLTCSRHDQNVAYDRCHDGRLRVSSVMRRVLIPNSIVPIINIENSINVTAFTSHFFNGDYHFDRQ